MDRRFGIGGSLSPDGRFLAFMGHVEGLRVAADNGNWTEVGGASWLRFASGTLCISDLEKAKVREFPDLKITGVGCGVGSGAWSPDGKRVLFCGFRNPEWYRKEFLSSIRVKDRWDFSWRLPRFLFICDVNTGASEALCEGRSGRWSPDGTQVAFLRNEGERTLCVVDSEGRTASKEVLSELWEIPDFCWSPDGKEICYLGYPERSAEDNARAMLGVDWDRGVWITSTDGIIRERLFSGYYKRVFWVSAFGETTPVAPIPPENSVRN